MKRVRVRGSTKQTVKYLAQREEDRLKAKAREKGVQSISQDAPVLREFVDATFLPWVRDAHSIEPKTKTYYNSGWRLLKETVVAGMRMDEIGDHDLDTITFPGSAYNANTALCTLRRIFGKALELGQVSGVPKIRKRKVWGRSIAMSQWDANLIASRMSGTPRDVLLILRATGMRPGECHGLRWEYLNWTDSFYRNPSGKTGSSRRAVPLLDDSIAILKRRHVEQGLPVQGWVFPSDSKSGHIVSITKAFVAARRVANLPEKMCLYTCRHGVGTDLAAVVSLKEVMECLGHTDARTAMKYQHPNVANLQIRLDEARTSGRIM